MDNKDKIAILVKEKKKIKEIARMFKITERQLKFLLDKWGVEIPKRTYNKIPRPSREDLLKRYNELGTTHKVAKSLGIGINTVIKWMKELKIPTKRLKMSDDEKLNLLEYHIDKIEIGEGEEGNNN